MSRDRLLEQTRLRPGLSAPLRSVWGVGLQRPERQNRFKRTGLESFATFQNTHSLDLGPETPTVQAFGASGLGSVPASGAEHKFSVCFTAGKVATAEGPVWGVKSARGVDWKSCGLADMMCREHAERGEREREREREREERERERERERDRLFALAFSSRVSRSPALSTVSVPQALFFEGWSVHFASYTFNFV